MRSSRVTIASRSSHRRCAQRPSGEVPSGSGRPVGDRERRLGRVGGGVAAGPREVTSARHRGRRSRPRRPRAEHRHGLRDHVGDPGGLEREVHAIAPVRSRTASTASTDAHVDGVGGAEAVGPLELGAATSTAINRAAPAIRAPCRAAPDPSEADHRDADAGPHLAVCTAAPTPVETPQPRRHALEREPVASGSPAARGRRCGSRGCPAEGARERLGVRAPGEAGGCIQRMRATARGAAAARTHRPHGTAQRARRGRRERGVSTPSPTASTNPAPSWPSSIGNGAPQFPFAMAQSREWQTPLATSRTSTSPASGASIAGPRYVRRWPIAPPRRRAPLASPVSLHRERLMLASGHHGCSDAPRARARRCTRSSSTCSRPWSTSTAVPTRPQG